jgi:EAL domain-containing protein (putative c-di-GMP-specific phosphodiesterase class I)
VSVGIAFAEAGADADALLRNADAAMYQAKAEGKGRHAVFNPALVAAAAERLELEQGLARAVEALTSGASDGGFALAYQPVVSLESGAVEKVEALLRWQHPARGPVSPARFIPVAEGSGLIVALGRWVLEEACRAAAGWPSGAGGRPVGIAVNVSGRQLADPGLAGHVAGALAASGLDPARLTLEITESVLMHDTTGTLAVLHALKALGVRLAVDDFGTGYSSLRYLQQFPVDVLKIDKSFVDGVARGGHDAALARTIVALGDMLALRTVAEGVEDAAQADVLRAMGCEYAQGYLFARPTDGPGLLALLEAGAAAAA